MKKFVCFILIGFSLSFAKDFRETSWGFSKEQVKKVEKAKFIGEDEQALYYKANVGGYKAMIIYNFDDGKLDFAAYHYEEKHTNENRFLREYFFVNESLNEKYERNNKPVSIWENDLYKNDKDKWGFAVSIGHLVLETIYTTPTTIISHKLDGDNYEIDHYVLYTDANRQTISRTNDL